MIRRLAWALALMVSLTPALRAQFHREMRLQLAEKCAAEGDVLGWGKALMPDKFRLPFCELHQYLVDTRDGALTSTEAPRGHGKTVMGCFLIPLYQALVEPRERHFLQIQSNADKALTVNRSIKSELEQNSMLQALYGKQVGERWTDACFVLKNGVVFSAEGYGASIRGLNYRNRRPTDVILDDFYEVSEDVHNPAGTIKKNDWYFGTLYPIMAQDRKTCMHIRGTACNREDLFFRLKDDPKVMSKTFQAITDWDKREVLWKGLKTYEDFMDMQRRMGSLIFAREFQNERRDDSSSIVKQSWLYPSDGSASWEYDPAELRFNENLLYAGAVVTLDPSIGANKKTSDYSAYARVLIAQPTDGSLSRFYIEEVIQAHHSFQQRIDTVKELIAHRPVERPVSRVRVESVSGFADIGERIAASVSVPCDLVDHVPNKLTNLEKSSAIFENRRIFLNRNIDPALKTELTNQLCQNTPRHDDLRDSVLLALTEDTASWSSWV